MNKFILIGVGLLFTLPLRADDKPAYNSDVQVKTLMRSSTNSAGQPIEYPHDGKPEVSILIVTIAPGKQTGWHRHPVPLFGYVLAGQVTVQLAGGDKHTFHEGDPLAECVNMLHNGKNAGKEPVKLVMFVTGAKGEPFTVKAAK